jgi:hypothetical protein
MHRTELSQSEKSWDKAHQPSVDVYTLDVRGGEARDLKFVNRVDFERLEGEVIEVKGMLAGLLLKPAAAN